MAEDKKAAQKSQPQKVKHIELLSGEYKMRCVPV